MAFTNLFMTKVMGEIGQGVADKLVRSFGLLSNVSKYVVAKGESSLTIPLPGALTSSKRTAGNVAPTSSAPTDTAVTFSPVTEYSHVMGVDRTTAARSAVDIIAFYKASIIDAIIGGLNTDLWALLPTGITTNSVGENSAAASPTLLPQAWTKLWTAKAPMTEVRCCIGGAESQSWKPAFSAWNASGPAGQDALVNGRLGMLHGFKIDDDQQRYYAGSVATNVAYVPQALGVAFRNETVKRPGTELYTWNAPAGIVAPSIFVELSGMDEATYGVGTKINVFCIADVKVVKEDWACLVVGAATA